MTLVHFHSSLCLMSLRIRICTLELSSSGSRAATKLRRAFRPWGDTQSAKRAREWKGLNSRLRRTAALHRAPLALACSTLQYTLYMREGRTEKALELEVLLLSSPPLTHSSIHQAQLFARGVPASASHLISVGQNVTN